MVGNGPCVGYICILHGSRRPASRRCVSKFHADVGLNADLPTATITWQK
jgi:hypothetical protein